MTEGRREGGFGKTWRLQQLQVELSHVGVVTVSPTMTSLIPALRTECGQGCLRLLYFI